MGDSIVHLPQEDELIGAKCRTESLLIFPPVFSSRF